ncbi:MAG: 16S rRNA (cytosine(1402)-N(4))-methyltransferase RsmH [Pseudomonadota bacterium]|mgnify:FL=1|nr:16S rRNA (cytosine(1402)-N(4))-methyltransferase RsmH [Pseudomonadota bacterium]|tara:strand:- start:1704 stop:2612 length:909 start_codon:yes stop_codon:yes gene_type:complete
MTQHVPVLRDDMVNAVMTDRDGAYLDATFGRGGHARALLRQLSPKASLVALDRDPDAYQAAVDLSREDSRVQPMRGVFSEIRSLLSSNRCNRLSGLMMDIGVSSPQLDDPARGFSFMRSGPLDMRMDPESGESAASWLNRVDLSDLVNVLRELGDEKNARAIAMSILDKRPLYTTHELVTAVDSSRSRRDPRKHSATRVFQAVRMHINDELSELNRGIEAGFHHLVDGGRIGVLTFHSIEHAIVRQKFRGLVRPVVPRRLPVRGTSLGRAKYVVKAKRPNPAEMNINPRSRSALLQVIERIE